VLNTPSVRAAFFVRNRTNKLRYSGNWFAILLSEHSGGSGLGLTTAKLMITHGATKIGLIDRNEQLLATSAEALRSLGSEAATAVADISRSETAH
jgi:hypothetical protein